MQRNVTYYCLEIAKPMHGITTATVYGNVRLVLNANFVDFYTSKYAMIVIADALCAVLVYRDQSGDVWYVNTVTSSSDNGRLRGTSLNFDFNTDGVCFGNSCRTTPFMTVRRSD